MFTNRTRLFIGSLFFISLISLISLRFYEFAAVAVLMLVALVWDYFNQGTLIIASRHFFHKDYQKTSEVLAQIKRPDWLGKKRRGYYEYIKGGVCLQNHDFDGALQHYENAVKYPLRSVNDHVAALVHVANISIRQKNYEKAAVFIDLANQYDDKINAKMKDVIERLKKELKSHKQ